MGGTTDGVIGEDIAAGYLKLTGYEILRRNYRARHLEVDIIAEAEGCLVFVEVKTRREGSFGTAVESIQAGKMSNMRKAAEYYLCGIGAGRRITEFRFDAVAIDIKPAQGKMVLRHIRGIE